MVVSSAQKHLSNRKKWLLYSWTRRQSREYFEKSDERKTAGVRNGQIHLIHLHGSDFIQEMDFFVSGRFSSIPVIPSFLVIPVFHGAPSSPLHLDELPCFNPRLLISCYWAKHSGEQKRGWWWASSCVSAWIAMSLIAGGAFGSQLSAERN